MTKFESEPFISQKRPQILASVAAALGAFVIGNVVAWTSPVLPLLKVSEQFKSLSYDEISWIASLVPLGGVIGGQIGGYSIGKYGRQFSIFLLCFPCAFGWLLILLAQNVSMMCLGRFITGICSGAFCLVIPLYLSEIGEQSIRGVVGSMFPLLCSLGVLSTYILGTFVSWETLTIFSACVPFIQAVFVYRIPESPTFLISKGRRKATGKSLMRLRGTTIFDDIEPELIGMENTLGQNRRTDLTVRDYFTPEVLKPLSISMVLMILQQFGGINAVIFYTVNIFQSAGSDINANLASIIVGVVLLIGMLLSVVFIDRAGRRVLLIVSDAAMAVCLFGLGFFFYVKSNNDGVNPEGLTWLPLTSLVAYSIAFNLGVGPLPWLMMAELLPSHVKGATSALATSFNWLLAFFVTKFFIEISVVLGMATCYFMFAACCAFGTVFVYFLVPETKGKTLEEIQKSFL